MIERDHERAARLESALGRRPTAVASAPGRVNLLGEHTDYNGGFVLPTVIPQRTWVALARRPDRAVTVRSLTLGESGSYELGNEARRGGWIDYVQGVTRALSSAQLVSAAPISGFDLVIESDVPIGSGLSSSAAIEVAVLRVLRDGFELAISDLDVARLAQWGENHLVGAPVGILDPMACSMGEPGIALFIDTRTQASTPVEIPASVELVVVDSGVAHDHASGDYRTRRSECHDAARQLGVAELRDLGLPDLGRIAALPAPLDRRARHIVTENERVLRGVDALRSGDVDALGALFSGSHASMRDDFDVSVPAVDLIVERARRIDGALGARLTGGGFGGAVVVLARAGRGREIARILSEIPRARVLVPPEERARPEERTAERPT